MKRKHYTEGPVNYFYAGKWHFEIPSCKYEVYLDLRGRENADKVAKLIAASVNRARARAKGNMPKNVQDKTCRDAIRKVLKPVAWRPDFITY